LSYFPSFKATLLGVALGILIPFLSSIVPISKLLSKNLNDSLNASRSKTKGSIVSVNEGDKQKIGAYLLFGGLAVIAGISIYYLMPVAVLNLNLGLLLQIFFLILLGLILGLTLIAFNF
jgi:hypothetical protein